MAKISARGATETARITAENAEGGRTTLVLTSDGRVLRKWHGIDASYHLLGRLKDPARDSRQRLAAIAVRFGYTVTR